MRAGSFSDGRLPPEADLARQLGVSRATVRAALQTLADDGIVTRRRRHGTVINDERLRGNVPLNRLLSFREMVEQSGFAAAVDPLTQRLEVPPAPIAAALRLTPPQDTCLMVGRLVRADGLPVITVTDFIPLQALLIAPEDVPQTDTTFSLIAAITSATVDHSHVEIVPSVATEDEPAHLGLRVGTAYAELREVIYSPAQEPVAFSLIAVDCRRVPLTLVRLARPEAEPPG